MCVCARAYIIIDTIASLFWSRLYTHFLDQTHDVMSDVWTNPCNVFLDFLAAYSTTYPHIENNPNWGWLSAPTLPSYLPITTQCED